MASKRKPLDDARRRVKEKLNAIDEQKEFIQNSIDRITSGVTQAGNSLIAETNKTKFFHKYRAVSQELEKCLDDLLLINDTISSLEDEEGESAESEEDDKPPDDLSPTIHHEEKSPDENDPICKESKHSSSESLVTSVPADERPSIVSSIDFAKDLIDFETESSNPYPKETIPEGDYCLNDLKSGQSFVPNDQQIEQEAGKRSFNTSECSGNSLEKGNETPILKTTDHEDASLVFDLVDIGESFVKKPSSLQLLNDSSKSEIVKANETRAKEEDNKNIITAQQIRDSTTYVNELFMATLPLSTPSEEREVTTSLRRGSFGEENGELVGLNGKNISTQVDSGSECGSPTTVRLQRIGFCEYKSQETVENFETANEDGEAKITLAGNEKAEITSSDVEIKADKSEELKIACEISETREQEEYDTGKSQVTPNDLGESKLVVDDFGKREPTVGEVVFPQKQNKTVSKECLKTSSTSVISGQSKMQTDTPCESKVLKQGNECQEPVEKGPQIPAFEIPEDKCVKVTVKEIVSPKDFWIQKTNDDLDLLMEKMCYHFSKLAKSGDKGGLEDLPEVGHVCCGRYTVDDVWYRALVTAVSRKDNSVGVLYVDEGNAETLPLSRLRELDGKFASLPCQALRVQLRGLELREDVKIDKVNDWFKRRVSGETLEAVLYENEAGLNSVPLELYIRPHARSASDLDYQKLECNLHEMLVREGFAIRAASSLCTGSSDDVSPPSSPSDQVSKTESVISSSVTSGFHDGTSPTFDASAHEATSPCSHDDNVVCRVPPPCIPVDSDGSVFMLVSHIVDPGEFYVHCISSEAGILDSLMTEMNLIYKDLESQGSSNFSPRVGEFCCAKFSADGNWYRGLVLRSGDLGEQDIKVEVFYIDFGNIEQVGVGDLRELLPQFMAVPAQIVRCALADVNPSIEQEFDGNVFDDLTSEQEEGSKLKSSLRQGSRRKRRSPCSEKGIVVAGGDEDSRDQIPIGDVDQFEMLLDNEDDNPRDRIRSSISEGIAKSYREPSLFSDTAVELFERTLSTVEEVTLKPNWSQNSTRYFESLTMNARKLVGYVVPWDSTMLNSIVSYSQGEVSSLPNLGPVLKLNLYDVSGDKDVFINAAMVRATYASSYSIKDGETDVVNTTTENFDTEVYSEAGEFSASYIDAAGNWNEQVYSETQADDIPATFQVQSNGEIGSEMEGLAVASRDTKEEDYVVVKVHESELLDIAKTSQDVTSTPPLSQNPSPPSSPISPTSQLLDPWDPMSHDFQSFRNAYSVQTDNLDVAITGYEEDRGKICRFYRTKYGCFRGSKCSDKHVDQDVSNQVFIFGSAANPIKLPDIGAFVLARITAIYNPAHFWVQLPYGVENLTSQVIKNRSGKESSGEENLKDFNNLMKEMEDFYSKMFNRKRSLIPPTEGELVVTRSVVDNMWYRGKICKQEDQKYKVLFVDYGIVEWIHRTNIYPIMPQFLHLPFRSVECYLSDIAPKSEDWTEDSREHFKTLVDDKVLVCQVLSIINKTMYVNLFRSDKEESQNITEQMIASGFAHQAASKIRTKLQSVVSPKNLTVHPG